jgi:nitrite reductase/ring-hydroxylating ferredoxin subunit
MTARFQNSRRIFIKTFTFAAAYSCFYGKAWNAIFAAEITSLAASSVGILRLRLADFPALLNESGSVRLGINPLRGSPPSGPLPDGQFYPVIINRGPNNTFYALNSRCTHLNCTVDAMNSFNLVTCPCHGSIFGIDGKRLGGPALSPLTRYTINLVGQTTLEVQIPNLGYSVSTSRVQADGSGASRYPLVFRAFRNVDYEVYFRELLGTEPATVPFSTTLDGPVEQTVFKSSTTTTVTLYVERNGAAGFFTVAIRAAEV